MLFEQDNEFRSFEDLRQVADTPDRKLNWRRIVLWGAAGVLLLVTALGVCYQWGILR